MKLSKEDLIRKLQARVGYDPRQFAMQSIHLVEKVVDRGTRLKIGPHLHEVPSDSFLVIVDQAPGAYWTHPVNYELHEVDTGDVQVIQEKHPIEAPDFSAALLAIHVPDLPHLRKKPEGFLEPPSRDIAAVERRLAFTSFDLPAQQAAHRWALFVTGMDNMPDFHDDFVRMRDILLERYGYDPAHITVVMGDGTSYADLPVDHPGTVAGLDAALAAYAGGGTHALGADDHLFLYTFDHGGADAAGSYLCMAPDWDSYHSTDLLARLNAIQCGELIVAMNQCHSGGFVADAITTTGPASVAIMTACRGDQSAYPSASTSNGGYFSGALETALNFGFPATITPDFPGWTASEVAGHDTNVDGLISVEEAWNRVHDEMHAQHWATQSGIETPQWGVSSAGVGASLFWGKPDIEVADGDPTAPWESPDIVLVDPAFAPDDATTSPGGAGYWGDNYHPDVPNRVVARVHNFGCAPARNVQVELRVMSFGVGGGTTLIGTPVIASIDPGLHAYAWVDWNFPSALVHRCAFARATCAGDPALPFTTSVVTDDNQAQRNMDALYIAPGAAPLTFERAFVIQNPDLREEAVFQAVLGPKAKPLPDFLRVELPEAAARIALKPRQAREVRAKFTLAARPRVGEIPEVKVQIKTLLPKPAIIGGVTLRLEMAVGRLEGQVVTTRTRPVREGSVSLENIKLPELRYKAALNRLGGFSFRDIAPGPYRIVADCPDGVGRSAVFVEPNRITRKVLVLEPQHVWIGDLIRKEVREGVTVS